MSGSTSVSHVNRCRQRLEAECLRMFHKRPAEAEDRALVPSRQRGTHDQIRNPPIDDWPMLRACHDALRTLAGWTRGRRSYG